MSVTDDDRAFAQGMYRHHPQSPGRHAFTFDESKPRPSPDDITARAEEYVLTGLESCYASLQGKDREEFWAETIRLKRIHGLGAWSRK